MNFKTYLPALGAAVLGAGILAVAAFGFRGLATQHAEEELQEKLRLMLPDSTSFTRREGDGNLVQALYEGSGGAVVQVRTKGYVYDVELLVAVRDDGTVTGLAVRDAHETTGLGSAILSDHAFLAQFLKTDGQAEIGRDIVPITGATVSCRAVSRCVSAAVAAVTGEDVPSQATPWGEGA